MKFEYFYTTTAMGELDVEDVGNCTLQACSDDGNIWYLMTQSTLGWTKIFEYGPCTPDFDELPKSVMCYFGRIPVDEKKISKKIQDFINNPKRLITQVTQVEKEVAWQDCKSIIEYMKDENNF